MTTSTNRVRPPRADLTYFDADERLALKLGLLAVVSEHPGSYGRTRLSGAFAHMPIDCEDEAMLAVAMPRPLPAPMPSGRALLMLIDQMVDEGLLGKSPTIRPTLHLTKDGFSCLAAG